MKRQTYFTAAPTDAEITSVLNRLGRELQAKRPHLDFSAQLANQEARSVWVGGAHSVGGGAGLALGLLESLAERTVDPNCPGCSSASVATKEAAVLLRARGEAIASRGHLH